jgi:hypothetical protein
MKKSSINDKYNTALKRVGSADYGKGNGSKPAPKGKVSLKGTNPAKKQAALTWKKVF